MVVNLDDCIAITQNYVSTSNLSDCLRFLREKPDQISGNYNLDYQRQKVIHIATQFLVSLSSFFDVLRDYTF
jgi:hypothetical protein